MARPSTGTASVRCAPQFLDRVPSVLFVRRAACLRRRSLTHCVLPWSSCSPSPFPPARSASSRRVARRRRSSASSREARAARTSRPTAPRRCAGPTARGSRPVRASPRSSASEGGRASRERSSRAPRASRRSRTSATARRGCCATTLTGRAASGLPERQGRDLHGGRLPQRNHLRTCPGLRRRQRLHTRHLPVSA